MNLKKLSAVLMCVCSLAVQTVPPVWAETDASARFDSLESRLSQIEDLLGACKAKGIPVDYETVDYTVIKKFILYGRQDIENNYTERADYTADKLESMYNGIYESLNSYLDGSLQPRYANRYQTSTIDKNRTAYTADVKNGESGAVERGNVFFTGYMGYDELINDIEILPDLGVNIMGLEIGVRSIIIKPGTGIYGGWRITSSNAVDGTSVQTEENIGQNSTKGLHIKNSGGTVKISKSVQLKPNTVYEIGCSSINNSGDGVTVNAGESVLSVKNTSSRFATSKTTFTSGSSCRLTVTINSNAVGDNVIDNMFIREQNTSENILINSGFETDITEKNGLWIDAGAADDIINSLKRAGKSNIAADLLISPHYFPEFVLEEDSSYSHGGSGFGGGGVEWYKDRIKEVMNEYIDALIPMVKDYPALTSICLSNEPMFNLMYSEGTFATPMWRAWLQEKYQNIYNLNNSYGTSYSSFSSVPKVSSMTKTQMFYDWKEFNEEMFADWHSGMADRIRAIAPNIKIHSKMVDYLSRIDNDYESKFMLTGTDANKFSEFSDIHGNDAHAYLEENHMYQMQSKLEWYDFLTTVSEKPIHNSEDHVIKDKSKIYTDLQAKHVAADIWQGALHGRSSTNMWVYARTYDESSLLMDSLLHRPDVMSAVGKTNLDLNRTADQMTALQNTEPEVGVLFSTSSRVYSREYMNCLYKSYEALLYSGFRAAVLDEKAMAAGKADKLKLLIIPDIQYVSSDMLNALKTYAANGGKILALGDNCLAWDDYKKSNSSDDINAVLKNAVRLSAEYSSNQLISPSGNEILGKVRELAPNSIKIIDSDTGEELQNTEYRYTDYGGRKLINICSYEWNDKNAEVYIDGKKAVQMYDVVNEKQIENLKLQGYTPVMFYADTSELEEPLEPSAVWDNGAYKLSWSLGENSSADYVNIYITDAEGTRFLDRVDASALEYSFKSSVNGRVSFTLKSENAMGYVSDGVTAELENSLAAGITSENGKLVLEGYSKNGKNVAYTVIPNGENPADISSLAAFGEIKPDSNNGFKIEINLNNKIQESDDFLLYAGNGLQKQTMYFTYKAPQGRIGSVFAVYNYDGYDIYWNVAGEDVSQIKINDGTGDTFYAPEEGHAFYKSGNVKKEYTLTAVTNSSSEESVTLSMPVPLVLSCRALDGAAIVSGVAQPGEKVRIIVMNCGGAEDNGEALYVKQLTADDYGRFEDKFVLENSLIPQDERLIIQIVTETETGKEREFVYTGEFPVHTEGSGQSIKFTSYVSRAVENACAVFAFYDASGLVKCRSIDLNIEAGETISEILEEYGDYKLKVFVWDGMSGMKPLSRAYIVE